MIYLYLFMCTYITLRCEDNPKYINDVNYCAGCRRRWRHRCATCVSSHNKIRRQKFLYIMIEKWWKTRRRQRRRTNKRCVLYKMFCCSFLFRVINKTSSCCCLRYHFHFFDKHCSVTK